MARHDRFEWDDAKAKANIRRHRVSFTDAMRVLSDEYSPDYHVEEFDATHSQDEDRYITAGSDPFAREIVLMIVWCDREGITRIISARAATRSERKAYEREIERRKNHP